MKEYAITLEILIMERVKVEANNEEEAVEEAMRKSNFGRDGEMFVQSIQKLPDGEIKY